MRIENPKSESKSQGVVQIRDSQRVTNTKSFSVASQKVTRIISNLLIFNALPISGDGAVDAVQGGGDNATGVTGAFPAGVQAGNIHMLQGFRIPREADRG